MPDNHAHDEFLELCALSASGQLNTAEQQTLDRHLATCWSCREALRQYQALVEHAIPAHAAGLEPDENAPTANSPFSDAEQELLDRVAQERQASEAMQEGVKLFPDVSPPVHFSGEGTWRNVWLLYAAGILLSLALGMSAYRVGVRQGTNVASTTVRTERPENKGELEQELSDVSYERQQIRAQLLARDQTIADLRLQLQHAMSVLKRTVPTDNAVARPPEQSGPGAQDVAQQQASLSQKLADAETEVGLLQAKLNTLDQQSAQDAARAATLEAEVNQLTQQLHERDATVDQQQDLLAHDRDIRELMGARDLYIAEVYDVGRTGTTQKPYGRVFYTKGKSLVFYAYDLDQQTALRNAKTFQAWGRRGPDTQRAVNLGIFYVDNSTKKRWVLKSDDPQKLAEIDAVFVTVEPSGGSHRPSSQPLLFTYLKVDPNHP